MYDTRTNTHTRHQMALWTMGVRAVRSAQKQQQRAAKEKEKMKDKNKTKVKNIKQLTKNVSTNLVDNTSANNMWPCDTHDNALIKFLQNFKTKIIDQSELTIFCSTLCTN